MTDTAVVEARFNGPQQSGNGGYSSGVFASALGSETTEVTLRSPIPLDRQLAVERDDGSARILDGETLVAEVRTVSDLALEPPPAPSLDAARTATGHYRGERGGVFSSCFVCGLDREDAFGVFAGPVPGSDLVASPWTPPSWAADDSGAVRPEFVWAVLDCPTFFACYRDASPLPLSFLARFTARIDAPIEAGAEHIVAAWPLGADGRKHEAGSAVFSADGEPLALARALLIEPRPQ